MPRPRLEITQRLVFHLIQLGKELGDEAGRTLVIGKQIVANAVASRTPQHLVPIDAQVVARGLQVPPIAQLECRVEMAVRTGADQVDGVVINAATEEREEISHPVGDTKAQHIAIELGYKLGVLAVKRDVTELVRDNALGLEFLVQEFRPLEYLHYGALRIFKANHVCDGWLRILLAGGLHVHCRGLLFKRVEIVIGADLKSDARALGLRAFFQDDRVMVDRA